MAYRVEDQILPADFPKPKPVSITQIVQERDGNSCRLCSTQVEGVRLLNLLPGHPAGERPELGMVLACSVCELDAKEATRPQATGTVTFPTTRRMLRMLRLLYLENCEMAKITPLKAVAL